MTEPWHDECRRLRAEGLSQPEIAARLKQSRGSVARLLNESEEEKAIRRRERDRKRDRAHPRDRTKRYGDGNRNRFHTYWTARAAAPQTITPAIKQAAILAFSNHEIDVAELMKRITPRDTWSREGLFRVELVSRMRYEPSSDVRHAAASGTAYGECRASNEGGLCRSAGSLSLGDPPPGRSFLAEQRAAEEFDVLRLASGGPLRAYGLEQGNMFCRAKLAVEHNSAKRKTMVKRAVIMRLVDKGLMRWINSSRTAVELVP